jgi:putative ABC transport system permease protein
MKLLYIDQLRKIKQNLFNFISLSVLVLIISMTFTGVKSSVRRLEENYDDYLASQQIEDFYFNMGEVDVQYLGGTAIMELCTELQVLYECGVAFGHPNDPIYINNLNFIINNAIKEQPEVYDDLIDSYVTQFTEMYDFTVEKSYVYNIIDQEKTYKFQNITETINIPYLVKGELPVLDNEISIFPEFASLNNIDIGDFYTINNKEYEVVGFHYQPEMLFPIFSLSSISFDPQNQTIVLANDKTLKDLNQTSFTKYLVHGDLTPLAGDIGYDTIQSGDYSFLGKNLQMVNILMPRDINFRIISLEKEVTNAKAFINIFLPLFTGFITLLLVVFMKRYIDKNKKDIDTLHALGYTHHEISRSILLYPLLISLFAIVGYLLGQVLSNQLFDIYAARYLFPKAESTVYFDILIIATIVPILLITIINYIFIRFTLSHKITTLKKVKIRIFKFTPVRTIFSTFLLFITVSTMILFSLNGNSMFRDFTETTKEGNNYVEMIILKYMTNTDHLDTYEAYTRTGGLIIQVNSREVKKEQSTLVYGINPNSSLKRLMNNDIEKNLLLNDGVITSDFLRTTLSLEIGDTITFEVGGVQVTEKVVGFSNELLENNLFTTKEKLNSYYNLDDTYYNGLYTTDKNFTDPNIFMRVDYQNSVDEFGAIINVSSLILNFLIVISVALSIFIFVLILISYFVDNRFHIAVLKSIGYNNQEINQKYLLSIYVILLISFVISIPITISLLDFMLRLLMESIGFKLVVNFSILRIIFGFIGLNIIFLIVTYYSTKYYESINISELMKHEIK